MTILYRSTLFLSLLTFSCASAQETALDLLRFEQIQTAWLDSLSLFKPEVALRRGKPVASLPDFSLEGAHHRAKVAQQAKDHLSKLDLESFPQDKQADALTLLFQIQEFIDFPPFFHLQFDLTPYHLNLESTAPVILAYLRQKLPLMPLATMLDQLAEKIRQQQDKGILLPKIALIGVRNTIGDLKTLLSTQLSDSLFFQQEIQPRLDAIQEHYGENYERSAPEQPGLWQYPGGKAYYQFLIKKHTTLDLNAADIHHLGIRLQEEQQTAMAKLRKASGFEGDHPAYMAHLKKTRTGFPTTPEALEKQFNRYLDQITNQLPQYFYTIPDAPFAVMPLDPTLADRLTFGYYQGPSKEEPKGIYFFNASNIDQEPMIWAGPLIVHELLPGHHFRAALQKENNDLSDYRRHGIVLSALNYAWANHAIDLAEMMGIFKTPIEQYGRLLNGVFIITRLVVDTGINYFGWTLEEASAYMKAYSPLDATAIQTELIRYSTDIPGQALSYKLGANFILELRQELQETYGTKFDIRDFNDALTSAGSLPLSVLAEQVKKLLSAKYD